MEQVLKNFRSRGFKAFYFKDAEAAKRFVAETIGSGATVGIGGSATVAELGLYELLSKGNKVYWHGAPDRDENTMRNAAGAEYYVSSANALGAGGEIVNIDARRQSRKGGMARQEHRRPAERQKARAQDTVRRQGRQMLQLLQPRKNMLRHDDYDKPHFLLAVLCNNNIGVLRILILQQFRRKPPEGAALQWRLSPMPA